MNILIKGGHVIDPKNKVNSKNDVLLSNGKVQKVAPEILPGQKTRVIDADGLIVTPGLIDMHVHLREPGREDKDRKSVV